MNPNLVISRRAALTTTLATAGVMLSGRISMGAAQPLVGAADLRGGIDAGSQGLRPDAASEQSRKLASIIAKASRDNQPVFLPPGTYVLSNMDLPDGTRLHGVSGATKIIYGGGGHLFRSEGARRVELANLVLDGAGGGLGEHVSALVHMRSVGEIIINNCEIIGSAKTGIQLERCGGRIDHCRITDAADYAVLAIESTGLAITSNTVADCGNGGILVHRRTKGADGTLVSGNRITGTRAGNGGTGQYGNAINIYRADNVQVIGNHVSASAFSAIRSNAGSNVQIANNQCLASGETAIYSEFGFEGAMVSGNLVNGAANGISIVNFNEGGRLATVSGNVVRNLSLTAPYEQSDTFFGLGISVEADTAVTGNVIENAPRFGLLLGWGPYLRNVVVNGNVVREAKTGCAVSVADGAGSAVITNNLFERVPGGGIIGYRWHDVASSELSADASGYPQHTVIGNRVI
ncbi:TIGR03808 family TAT-translocated repetitive protein [Rhizobiales bacterium RZME27]|uniref:TIGR03808 family TAT-translocated repetitive protein n=1 Tax=Endobacterium cereale TaxID=2663029 RepID=A0A6A8AE07_9HYPH|nr:TIGR03808 family TAT-translocated repetitive protein [Endobacterium cereale]MEB2844391.1 TIGR03808 family TAT-translocated repetitive protein [Endobacterium cereale]MQY46981.1 TIGR03808 family TAT-translocated repetitive protein [Endobacterium cereale]